MHSKGIEFLSEVCGDEKEEWAYFRWTGRVPVRKRQSSWPDAYACAPVRDVVDTTTTESTAPLGVAIDHSDSPH